MRRGPETPGLTNRNTACPPERTRHARCLADNHAEAPRWLAAAAPFPGRANPPSAPLGWPRHLRQPRSLSEALLAPRRAALRSTRPRRHWVRVAGIACPARAAHDCDLAAVHGLCCTASLVTVSLEQVCPPRLLSFVAALRRNAESFAPFCLPTLAAPMLQHRGSGIHTDRLARRGRAQSISN